MGSRTNFGLITGLGQDIRIGRAELFNLGGVLTGDGDLRGYPDYEFGGWYGDDVENGLTLFATSLELRYPLRTQLIGVFADAGTPERLSRINSNLYKSVDRNTSNVPIWNHGLDSVMVDDLTGQTFEKNQMVNNFYNRG